MENAPDSLVPEPGGFELAPGVRIPAASLRIQFSRGSGPGGQNVNKVNTRVEIWAPIHHISGLSPQAQQRLRQQGSRWLTAADELHIASDSHRSQDANRREVFDRLRELIVRAASEPKRRRKTRPTRAARQRRLESKRRRGEIKAQRSKPA